MKTKTLIFLFFLSIIIGCVANRKNVIHEDTMYVTRKFCGNFDTLIVEKKTIRIITDEAIFHIWGNPKIDIPKNRRCYVKYIPEKLPGSSNKVWVLYFTWDGTEDLIELRQNWITGEIY